MAKNRSSLYTNQHTPSSPPSNTLGPVVHLSDDDEEEEEDICPVCDGECTCNNKPRVSPPGPLSMAQFSALRTPLSLSTPRSHLVPPISTHVPGPEPLLPSFKIKLTVPQSMLGKRRALPPSNSKKSNNVAGTISATEVDGDTFPSPSPHASTSSQPALSQPYPKRRGRPPKAIVAARQLAAQSIANVVPTTKIGSLGKQKKSSARLPASLQGRTIIKKSTATAAPKRRPVVSSEPSDPSDVDHHYNTTNDDGDDEEDAQSGRFPTFVSASVLSSRASSSSEDESSNLSSFGDSDISIEAEEENFILSEVRDRARVRRELLGDDAPKKRDQHNAWIIRPRQKSAGPSDVEMDIDSDATEDEDDEEEEPQEDDEDETDEKGMGAGYVGLATGWSDDDDDESSFDADLFFANLSDDSEIDHDGSSTSDSGGDDGDHSDMESMEASIASLTAPPRAQQDNLALEVTQGWDGQITFTNGLSEGQGILDMDFEAHAAQFAETSSSPSQDSDVEMASDDDDGGYEEDVDGGEGDTTDEELVGEDDLPNERAMRLFNLPSSVSAINPMSTMSPVASPHPRARKPWGARSLELPKPADILSGKIFWDSDDHDEFEDTMTRSYSLSSKGGYDGGPRRGHFESVKETRQAIIDDSHKDIPSPHPRFRRRGTSSASFSSQCLPPMHSPVSTSVHASFQRLPTTIEETGVASQEAETSAAEFVDLNDLLEASFLDPDPSDSQHVSSENEARKQLKNLNRWDHVSIGAFRQSHETSNVTDSTMSWCPDTPGSKSSTDYRNMMRSSPLSTMLWNKAANQKRTRKKSVIISPVILPLRDGDRTPTNVPAHHLPPPPPQQNHRYDNYPHKSRKELRRERKLLKQKSYGAGYHHPPHYHHSHHHHPNMKTRSSSSMQRSSSFISSVPPLNI